MHIIVCDVQPDARKIGFSAHVTVLDFAERLSDLRDHHRAASKGDALPLLGCATDLAALVDYHKEWHVPSYDALWGGLQASRDQLPAAHLVVRSPTSSAVVRAETRMSVAEAMAVLEAGGLFRRS